MTTDRWGTIERLFHAALERPVADRSAFLAQACAGDDSLEREVWSLLNQPTVPGFLKGPAVNVAAQMLSESSVAPWTGRRIGVYQLQALLGKGGMGEVYRARDTRLGRDVAIKVLPQAFTADPDRLARFEREARVLASLNHPHIGTIHGLEEGEGIRALVLELVEGETLADRVARGRVAIPDALAMARQIADALDAAHDKGIVHRDLKPANIKITPNGVVKVLDFGLAKSETGGAGADLAPSPTITAAGTDTGIILGTAAYMSPEQARGHVVDKRTDVWAFGCVLYELLTGRAAFGSATVSDTIAAILQRDPDWSALPAALPSGVVELLHRCLDKDAKRRKRDLGDARAELDDAIGRRFRPEVLLNAAAPRPARAVLLPWVVALAGVTAAVAGFWPRPGWQDPLNHATFTKLTDFPGTESDAAISPDGRFVAFLADRDGPFDIYLSQVGSTGPPVNLTRSDRDYRLSTASSQNIGFTGDGSNIWISGTPQGRRLQLLPLIGGTAPRAFLNDQAGNVSWAPDGSRLVYSTSLDGDPLFVAEGAGANPRQIHKGLHNHGPIWSPYDQWIYFVHGYPNTEEMDVWRIQPSGGEPEQLTRGRTRVNSLAPLDAHTLLYTSRDDDGSGPWLWALDLDSRISHRVSTGLEQYTSISASADGRHLVATVGSPRASLWTVPILDRLAEARDALPYQLSGVRALAPRVRGNSLFYLSTRGTGDGLWLFRDGKSQEIWPGSQGVLLQPAAVSPDGLEVVVVRRKGKSRTLMRMAVEGGQPIVLGESIDVNGTADWSPDHKWVVAGGTDQQNGQNVAGLFRIPVDGGAPVMLRPGTANDPVVSPDGKLILYAGSNVGGQADLLGVRPDGQPVALPPVHLPAQVGRPRFLPDGRVVVPQGRIRTPDFWLLDVAAGTPPRQLTNFTKEAALGDIGAFDITADGKTIIFDRRADNSDIVLIDIPRPPR